MKIIIAESKSMKYQNSSLVPTYAKYTSKQKKLLKILKNYSVRELHDLLKISFKIAGEVYNYYHQKNLTGPALYFYSGTVFKQLKLNTYNEADFDYLDSYLNIMSSYYGALKYHNEISYYRLDMVTKLTNLNLYQYWHDDIKKYFKNEDFIISLASKELTKMVNHPNIINIDFVENSGGTFSRKVMYIKMARGKMLDIMVKNKVTTIEEIKQINFDNYQYDDKLSTKNNLVFIRDSIKRYKQL